MARKVCGYGPSTGSGPPRAPSRCSVPAECCGSADFERGAAPALDGAVHVALPADARVLAGEEQTSCRTRQPVAQPRIEGRAEERVPATRERIGFPHDLSRS